MDAHTDAETLVSLIELERSQWNEILFLRAEQKKYESGGPETGPSRLNDEGQWVFAVEPAYTDFGLSAAAAENRWGETGTKIRQFFQDDANTLHRYGKIYRIAKAYLELQSRVISLSPEATAKFLEALDDSPKVSKDVVQRFLDAHKKAVAGTGTE